MRRTFHSSSKVVYLTVLIYIFYSLQGVLYPSGSFISQILMFLYLFIGLAHMGLVFVKARYNVPIFTASLFVVLNIIYYIFTTGTAHFIAYQQLKGVLACFTPFIVAYYHSRKGNINESVFSYLAIVLFFVCLLSFNRMNNALLDQVGTGDSVVNNVSYSFTRIIPLLMYINTKVLISVIFLLLINFFIIIGAKRGAAISAVVGNIGYFVYFFSKLHKSNVVHKILIILLIIGFVLGMSYFLNSYSFIIERFAGGDSRGRDYIYREIWSWWTASDTKLINFLFGGGLASSTNLTGGSLAHNDWLEVISNFGLLGVIVYGTLMISITIKVLRTKAYRDKISGLVIVLMWWATSMTSTWYNTPDNFPAMLLLGFLIGRNCSRCQNKVSVYS